MRTAAPGRRVVALDGPSGSGKSTVARGVASALGWRYVDTGATYRAATLAVLRAGTDLTDPAAVAAEVHALVVRTGLALSTDPAAACVRLDGEDVTAAVRSAPVTAAVSAVSAVPAVRTDLVALQRALMGTRGAVAEGRDVASVVAPEAAVKVYLDAVPAVRAARRAADVDAGVVAAGGAAGVVAAGGAAGVAASGGAAGVAASGGAGVAAAAGRSADAGAAEAALLAAVAADLARRDAHDSSRATSPLSVAPDAVHLEASALTAQQVIDAVLALAAVAGFARP